MGKKKQGADAVQQNALGIGHNSTKDIAGFVSEFVALEKQIIELRGDQKDLLARAKDSDLLKMGIRKAAKEILASEEQRQARQSVEQARDEYLAACREEGIFVPEEPEEEAA